LKDKDILKIQEFAGTTFVTKRLINCAVLMFEHLTIIYSFRFVLQILKGVSFSFSPFEKQAASSGHTPGTLLMWQQRNVHETNYEINDKLA